MDSKSLVNQLIINKYTLFLESKPVGKKVHTAIHSYSDGTERNKNLFVRKKVDVLKSPVRIIDHNLQNMISSYETSLRSSQKHLERLQKHKLPIVVGNYQGVPLVLFPIYSPESKQNIWILYNNVLTIEVHTNNTAVIFVNEQRLDLPIQQKTLVQQMTSSGILFNMVKKDWEDRFNPPK